MPAERLAVEGLLQGLLELWHAHTAAHQLDVRDVSGLEAVALEDSQQRLGGALEEVGSELLKLLAGDGAAEVDAFVELLRVDGRCLVGAQHLFGLLHGLPQL
mmetsp:Transcript_25288/g.70724  ORF Transcript_25288/g.70724 Transcript_25288/m.70724 type:complete len:102 (-) Transcript_25288:1099-1404(-)